MRALRTWLFAASPVARAAVAIAVAAALASGCDKPSDDSCRRALANIRHLLGTEKLSQNDRTIEGEVRRCRGGSKRASVDCAIRAKTVDELRACKLIDVPAKAGAAPTAPTVPAPPTAPAAAPSAPAAPASAPS